MLTRLSLLHAWQIKNNAMLQRAGPYKDATSREHRHISATLPSRRLRDLTPYRGNKKKNPGTFAYWRQRATIKNQYVLACDAV